MNISQTRAYYQSRFLVAAAVTAVVSVTSMVLPLIHASQGWTIAFGGTGAALCAATVVAGYKFYRAYREEQAEIADQIYDVAPVLCPPRVKVLPPPPPPPPIISCEPESCSVSRSESPLPLRRVSDSQSSVLSVSESRAPSLSSEFFEPRPVEPPPPPPPPPKPPTRAEIFETKIKPLLKSLHTMGEALIDAEGKYNKTKPKKIEQRKRDLQRAMRLLEEQAQDPAMILKSALFTQFYANDDFMQGKPTTDAIVQNLEKFFPGASPQLKALLAKLKTYKPKVEKGKLATPEGRKQFVKDILYSLVEQAAGKCDEELEAFLPHLLSSLIKEMGKFLEQWVINLDLDKDPRDSLTWDAKYTPYCAQKAFVVRQVEWQPCRPIVEAFLDALYYPFWNALYADNSDSSFKAKFIAQLKGKMAGIREKSQIMRDPKYSTDLRLLALQNTINAFATIV